MSDFFIPVMGTSFTIDTPIRVAKYGIGSVISIGDHILLERYREYYSMIYNFEYNTIDSKNIENREEIVRLYMDMLYEIRDMEFLSHIKKCETVSDQPYLHNREIENKLPGFIEANIMINADHPSYRDGKKLAKEYDIVKAALRGFSKCKYPSTIVLSSGINFEVLEYLSTLDQFKINYKGDNKKDIVIKVNDSRSALLQCKLLAKYGLLVKEIRIESGINCGGHVFFNGGILLPNIITNIQKALPDLYFNIAKILKRKSIDLSNDYKIDLSVQGGIRSENDIAILMKRFGVKKVGIGTPFLLCEEATGCSPGLRETMETLQFEDMIPKKSSPFGITYSDSGKIPFSNECGAACTKGLLRRNMDYTEYPICIASLEYKNASNSTQCLYRCLCHELANPGLIQLGLADINSPQSVCPGPSIGYFDRGFRIDEFNEIMKKNNSLPLFFLDEINLFAKYIENNEDIDETIFLESLDSYRSNYNDLHDEAIDDIISRVKGRINESLL